MLALASTIKGEPEISLLGILNIFNNYTYDEQLYDGGIWFSYFFVKKQPACQISENYLLFKRIFNSGILLHYSSNINLNSLFPIFKKM